MDRIQDTLNKWINKVPGYTGYRDKESRRDEDKSIRVSIADDISTANSRLTQYAADLASERELEHISRVESVVGQVRLLADRIRNASYGYGGLFGERDVDAAALDQLRMFDLAMQREVSSLTSKIDEVTNDHPPRAEDLRDLNDEVSRLSTLFDGRSDVINTAKPSRDEKVLDLLAIDEEVKVSPLLQVGKGEAISVLGDNYIANGTMTLSSPDGAIRLIRVSDDLEGAAWLMGSDVAGVPSAKLVEQGPTSVGFGTMATADATIDTDKGQQEGVAARYSIRPTDSGDIELIIVLGDSATAYRGTEINDLDIETYGNA